MKKQFLIITLSLLNFISFGQGDHIGQLKFVDCKITETKNVIDTVCGQPVKMVQLTITAKTKIQMSCNYGDPSKNKYETIKNKIELSYCYDSTGVIHDSIINEIKRYISEQEEFANKYSKGNPDFSYLPFHKSFFLKDNFAIPYIRTDGENPGDYQMFYVNKQVYKIKLLTRNGLGCLSSFVSQNMYFTKDGKRRELGEYIRNTDTAKRLTR